MEVEVPHTNICVVIFRLGIVITFEVHRSPSLSQVQVGQKFRTLHIGLSFDAHLRQAYG